MLSSAMLFLRAQTSMHPGAGSSVGAIDLPIQRERHTGWPTIQSSSLKGVLRDQYRSLIAERDGLTLKDADKRPELTAIFGPPVGESDEGRQHAGALGVTDARILAFPVRSAVGVFAWVTCAGVIERLGRDLGMMGVHQAPELVKPVRDNTALVPAGADGRLRLPGDRSPLILEDLSFEEGSGDGLEAVAQWVACHCCGIDTGCQAVSDSLEDPRVRLVAVSNDAFGHFVQHATEAVQRIALNYETKRVRDKALFTQELLPPETLMYSVLLAVDPRVPRGEEAGALPADSAAVIGKVRESLHGKLLQIGSDETTGKGWCWARVVTSEDLGAEETGQ